MDISSFLSELILYYAMPANLGLTSIFGVLSVTLLWRSLFDLGQNLTPLPHPRHDGQLVQTGIYGLVRHPLYSGVIFYIVVLFFLLLLMRVGRLVGYIF